MKHTLLNEYVPENTFSRKETFKQLNPAIEKDKLQNKKKFKNEIITGIMAAVLFNQWLCTGYK
jgi:hypothetical protein